MKSLIVLGGIGLGLGGALGPKRFSAHYSVLLSLFQLAETATCGLLLATRDRTTLMALRTAVSAASRSAR